MSLKQEIETWVAALAAYDNNEFDEALRLFDNIADTSKILFNCGVIHATLGEHEKAVESYQRATRLDQYLAVAYFQQGVSNFLMGDFEEALANFNDTLLYLRGNNSIDYEQLGLKFKLYSCEALFNRGLCYIYLQQKEPGMQDLMYAAREKVVPDHDVIDEAIREEAEGYTVFSIPVGIVYRPNEAKVKNLKTKDYLGKARLVAATDRANAFTGFTGAELKKLNEIANVKDDRPEEKISYAATNLVKPGLTSRSRQQSEPPITRNVFPPTPPPENDTRRPPSPGGYSTRSQSVVSRKPAPLDLGRAAFEQPKPRVMPSRSASERPAPSRQMSTSSRSTVSSRGFARDPMSGMSSRDMGRMRRDGSRERDMGRDMRREPSRERDMRREPSRERALRREPSRERMERDPIRDMRRIKEAREPMPRQPQMMISDDEEEEPYADDLYDMYDRSYNSMNYTSSSTRSRNRPQKPMYIEEEEEENPYSPDSVYDVDFEMVPTRGNVRQPSNAMPPASMSRRSVPTIKTIRVKVHADDTRYVFIDPNVRFDTFSAQIRDKFALRQNFKIKIRDDNDMITMSDQEDLQMAISNCSAEAKRERKEMGKMEVWVQQIIEHDTKRHVRRSPWKRHNRSSGSHGSSPVDDTDYFYHTFENNHPINNNHILKIDNTINKNTKTINNDTHSVDSSSGSTVNHANRVYSGNSASGRSSSTNVSKPSSSSSSSQRCSSKQMLRRSISGIWRLSRRQSSGDSGNAIQVGYAVPLKGERGN